ncbi:MAG TPA: tRNA (adenosine(37)-N6)-threonylcarbamoyltransferase complex dimerization subunit type 1 TsaB [Candidatus Eremiobacteraeota bacterium]|nr:MAG: tRNA threonylcarbamoyladenosine biosynthesis protein TsaB [bacterium ADurb.Bin363]HPZ10678.1 tRNA (adenosine(37)-N6)-threonylcarbamoyltransferase complex dimerization subunit type 1 TsaB [Candidatus Eremiobacteraeota bacterium]
MKVLGFDTATNWCSIGLIDGEELLGEWTLRSKMTQLTRLIPGIKMLLESREIFLSDIKGLSVTSGPGSFTGVRLGLVTAKTLSQVTGMDLIEINSLEAMVFQLPLREGTVIPLIDARKNEIYAGFYRWQENRIIKLEESNLFKPGELASKLNNLNEHCYFTGHGLQNYKNNIIKDLTIPFTWIADFYGIIRGSTVAYMGYSKLMAGEKNSYLDILPLYIRPPDAKVRRET